MLVRICFRSLAVEVVSPRSARRRKRHRAHPPPLSSSLPLVRGEDGKLSAKTALPYGQKISYKVYSVSKRLPVRDVSQD